MEKENLGIDPKTGRHSSTPLTRWEKAFVDCLWFDHVGKANKIPANDLAIKFTYKLGCSVERATDRHEFVEYWKREVRYMQNHLLFVHDHIPVYSRSGFKGGYWLGETEEEGIQFFNTFRGRGLTSFKKATRGRQATMVEMMHQLAFEFDVKDHTEIPVTRQPKQSVHVAVVDRFLSQMMRDPGRFSEDLERIGRKFNAVLLPKQRVNQIDQKVKELHHLVTGLVSGG